MKKNKMMRLASAMMVLTLMSTSVISGTFAKYVTSDSATDVARVAKFGVVVTADGTLFAETYKQATNTPGDGSAEVSVDSNGAAGDNVVAPGTKNDKGITFTITGTPEVDVKVDLEVTNKAGTVTENDKLEEIFLAKRDNLPDMTTGNKEDVFNNGSTYYPILYTVTCSGLSANETFNTVEDMADWLEDKIADEFKANTNLEDEIGTINITWAWDFDNSGAGTYDKQDTLLGDLAANTTLTPTTSLTDGTDYNLTTDLGITVTVTQID